VRADELHSKPRKPGATREAVVDAALQVVDALGVKATTIRRVAAAVGVPPMSLYAHFSKKEELLDFMYQEVALRLYADAGHPTWQLELASLCHQVRSVVLAHPRWVPLLQRVAPPIMLPLRERILPLMALDGISEDDALMAWANAIVVSLGFTLFELNQRAPDGKSALTTRFERLKAWSETSPFGEEHPSTRAALAKLQHLDMNRSFDAVVNTFVAGLVSRFSVGS